MQQEELLAALGFESGELLRQKRLEELQQAASAPLFSGSRTSKIRYPNVFTSTPTTALTFFGSSYQLPIGTIR